MPLAHSKVTAQGQISIPADVRKRLGIEPGSVIEWDEAGGDVVVRRSGRFTSEDIHKAIFGTRTPRRRSIQEMKEGIVRNVRERHADR